MEMFTMIALLFGLYSGLAVGVILFMEVPILGVFILGGSILCYFVSFRGNETKRIKVKYFDYYLEPIQKISKGDWIDLRAAERVEMKAGEYRLIRLGVGMILPDGYEAHILPRSSTPSKFGIMIANSMGVIDNSYSGDGDEWKCPAYAIRDTVIEKGDRIAQFRIMKNQPRLIFDTVSRLKDKNRGGIGSTGKR